MSGQGRALLQELEKRKRVRPWDFYQAVPAILPFHASKAPVRVLAGPNRGGKSTAGAFELSCFALGWNPLREERYATPNLCWAVALDNKRLGQVQKQRILEFLPSGGYRVYKQDGIIALSKKLGGSEIHLMSCESGPSKFQAAGVFAVWGDEEFQPSGLEIFNEIYSRIDPGQKLHIFLTFTPLQGYSWSYRRLWDPDDEIYLKGPGGVDNVVERFCFNLYDCDKNRGGFWETEDIERQIAAYHEYEKQARVFGQYSRIGGRPFFSPNQIIEAEKKAPKGKKARITIDALKQTRIEWTENGSWTVYEERKDNERYFMGIDVSGGSRRDRSVCYVIKRGTRERVARLKSDSIDAGRLAQFYAFPAARYYNNAVVIPEINGEFGGAFVTTLKRFYQRIWSDTQWDRLKEQRRTQIGWRTNDVTRGILLTVVEKALREEWPCFTDTCCHELMSILTKKSRDGKEKVEHADGCFDDEFFAMALALAVHEMRPMMKPFELEKGGEIYEDDPYLTAGMTG